MATETAFKGTLLLLQNRTRRDPESYRDEFLAQLDHFQASSATVAAQRTANPQYIAVLNYVTHVAHCFPAEGAVIARIVTELLRSAHGDALPNELRLALVKALMLLRSKSLVTPDETFPIFFTLLQERDKFMRKLILSHIVNDIRKVNMAGAKNGANINRRAQNYLFSVMAEDDPVQARCAELVMIDLYRRRVWADERTVEVLTKACFSRHTTILRTALRFFLMQMPKITSLDDTEDDAEVDPGRSISKLKQKLKIKKKTSKRERLLKRDTRSIKRKYNKEEKEEELLAKQHVDPIRLLRDPQQFVERLLAKLQKTSERFEVRLLYLNVLARTVSEHEVIHLPLYNFLERYMEPSQLHATQLLALSAMCVHRMTPPDAVEPLVKAIANHFVTDRSTPDSITVGINTIREICKRQPLAMEEDLLKDLTEYKNQRGDKGVIMAARALIQLYRDVYPELLPAKLRGSRTGPVKDVSKPVYGADTLYTNIPGLELLYQAENEEEANSQDDTSSSSDDDSSSSFNTSSGEWVTDTDSELSGSDVDGDFLDVSDSSDAEDSDAANDACPQLIPAKAAPSATRPGDKHARSELPSRDKQASLEESDAVKRRRVEDSAEADSENDADAEHEEEDTSDSDLDELESLSLEDDDEDDVVESDDGELEEVEDEEESDDESGEDENDEDESGEDESGEDESGDDESGEEEEEEEETGADALAAALSSAPRAEGWYEDSNPNSKPRTREPSITSSKASSAMSMASNRVLTDEDFEKIRKLQAQNGSHLSLRGKKKVREELEKKRQKLIHGVSGDLSSKDIEHFTERKRDTDKQEKIERAQELRKARSKFEISKKKKSKLNSTHGEHSKRGKLFQMTKRSARVATKLKSSVEDRAKRAKDMKKKDIKFRINRGWKA